MADDLYQELVNLIGEDYTKKIFDCNLDKLINDSDLTVENFNFAFDFFENADFDNINDYIEEGFGFLDVVKKFYDKELDVDTFVDGANRKLVLDRKFSFGIKKKIADILKSFRDVEECNRLFYLLGLIKDDNEFLDVQSCLKEIVLSDKLYDNIKQDEKCFGDAVNIVKYNLHESKKELSFKNLTWLVNILIVLPPESQNLVRIWINNIKSDEDCKTLEPVLISVIDCKKLTDDVLYKKFTVDQALNVYEDIKSKVKNPNLSKRNLNSAFSIIMSLQDDLDFNKSKLENAISLISLIYDDHEFEEVKIFIKYMSTFDDLPDLLKRNNFTLTEVLPVMLKIHFMGAEKLLKQNFSFDTVRKIIKILDQCDRNEKKIKNILDLTDKISSDDEFNYCEKFLFELSENKKMMTLVLVKNLSLREQIKKLYEKYFRVSSVSEYILKIIEPARFSFEVIKKMDRLIASKPKDLRALVTKLALDLKSDSEFIFGERFFNDFDNAFIGKYGNNGHGVLEDIVNYYKEILKVSDYDKNKLAVTQNHNLSFDSLSDAINLLSDQADEDIAQKYSKLICMIYNDHEYKILRPFFDKLIEYNNILSGSKKVSSAFYNILFEMADEFKIRKIFNNKFLSLEYKVKAMDYLKQIDDDDERNRLVDLICIFKSDKDYDDMFVYFDELMKLENLSNEITSNLITVEQIMQIYKLGLSKIWIENKISFDRVKKFAMFIAKQNDKDKINNFIRLMSQVFENEQFDIIFLHINDLIANKKISDALNKNNENLENQADENNNKNNGEEKLNLVYLICKLYELRAEKILHNQSFSVSGMEVLVKSLEQVDDKARRDYIISIACDLKSDVDFVYIKEYLLMADMNRLNKDYVEQACDFYVNKLKDKCDSEYKDMEFKIKKLVSSKRFSYSVLEQMIISLDGYEEEKDRRDLFNKMLLLKNDWDYVKNLDSLKNVSHELKVDEGSFSMRMKNATDRANAEIAEGGGGGGSSSSPLIFDDGNIVANIVDQNLILQFKDKKLVIMTTETIERKDEPTKNKLIKDSIRVNLAIDENLVLFDRDPKKYFDEFKEYLNNNGDPASLEDDQDEGIIYYCLITQKTIKEILDLNEKFCQEKKG